MPRTQRRVDGDLGYADGHIFVPVPSANITGSGAAQSAVTFNGIAGVPYASLPTTATAYVATFAINNWLFRYGVQDDVQEAFGAGASGQPFGAAGLAAANQSVTCTTTAGPTGATVTLTVSPNTAGLVAGAVIQIDTGANIEFQTIASVASATTITVAQLAKAHTANYTIVQNPFSTPAGVTGAPPFTGVTNLTPVTAARPKGVLIKTIYPVYAITGATASVNTISLIGTTFANAAATTTNTLITSGANGLQTAANSANQAYVTPIAVATAKQVYLQPRFTEYVITWSHTTGTGGAAALFGIYFDVTYNFV